MKKMNLNFSNILTTWLHVDRVVSTISQISIEQFFLPLGLQLVSLNKTSPRMAVISLKRNYHVKSLKKIKKLKPIRKREVTTFVLRIISLEICINDVVELTLFVLVRLVQL